MLDFCVTLPYGFLLALGGTFGYFKTGSTKSLMFGGGFGIALMFLGYLSLQSYNYAKYNYQNDKFPSKIYLVFNLFISAGVTAVMGKRYMDTGKVMPAAVVCGLSLLVSLFYVKKILHTQLYGHKKFTKEETKKDS
eukprot:maker-scaffold_13-snap-gene-9.55-mRNA-1 protein AED:0.34 eAED:0.34 QI:86/1/1/1/1/1/2/45/135